MIHSLVDGMDESKFGVYQEERKLNEELAAQLN